MLSLADIKDLAIAFAAVVTAVCAVKGLQAWKAQLIGKTNWEIARRFARAVYKVRDIIHQIRKYGMSSAEVVKFHEELMRRIKETGHAAPDIEPVIAALRKRRSELDSAWLDLSVVSLESEVLWGEENTEKATVLLGECVSNMFSSLCIYIDDYSVGYKGQRQNEALVRNAEHIIFGSNGKEFDEKLKNAVDEANRFVRPMLKLKGASPSSKPSSSKSGPSVVARIGLLVAVVGLGIIIWEINKEPVVELELFSPQRVINEITFDFKADSSWSEPLKLSISLVNKGNRKSESQILSVVTSPTIKAYLLTNKNWAQKDYGGDWATYSFEDRTLLIPSRNRRAIGSFNIQVPKTSSDILLALFNLQGDFEYNIGLIYYSPEAKKYIVNNFQNLINAQNIWNEHLSEHFQESTN